MKPSGDELTSERKDQKSFDALDCAGRLIDAVAGWALDHQIGLALNNKQNLPPGTADTENLPEYLAERQAVDDHVHELSGGTVLDESNCDAIEPAEARQMLINILRPLRALFPDDVYRQALDGLDALRFGGEPLPIFKAGVEGRKRNWREMRLQLKALAHVEYRHGLKRQKAASQEDVAAKFAVAADTLRTWERRLKEQLGSLEVARQLSFAKNAASHVLAERTDPQRYPTLTEEFSEDALVADGLAYKALLQRA